MQMSDYLSDLSSWEKTVKKKDKKLKKSARRGAKAPRGIRSNNGPINISTSTGAAVHGEKDGAITSKPANLNTAASNQSGKDESSAASHTYDKGYKKWETFDIDSALKDIDQDKPQDKSVPQVEEIEDEESDGSEAGEVLTPATMVTQAIKRGANVKQRQPRERRQLRSAFDGRTREQIEKDNGNDYYRKGDFGEAIKCYTRCVGMNPRNYVAYSNRAMTYIKQKQWDKAEEDCCSALAVNPDHVKSYLRRGNARNGLGRHRDALRDFQNVLKREPSNKQARTELRKTRELNKIAIRKTPRMGILIEEKNAGLDVPWAAPRPTTVANSNTTKDTDNGTRKQKEMDKRKKTGETQTKGKKIAQSEGAAAKSASPGIENKNTSAAVQAVQKRMEALVSDKPIPKSATEFELAWRELRLYGGKNKGEAMFGFMRKIPPKSFKKLCKSSSMDEELMIEMITILRDYFIPAGMAGKACSIMRVLTKVERFDMIAMFFTEAQSEIAADTVRKIAAAAAEGDESVSLDSLSVLAGIFT